MKLQTLKSIIDKKKNKSEFAIITNLKTGESEIFEKHKSLSKEMEVYSDQINEFFKSKKNGVVENSEIYFEISIIDPRGYFASEQRFPDMKIINKWPDEAFKEIETNENTALIALTHDPKIDDPALQHALNKKFYYIGALGSKKTHENRCQRLKDAGFNSDQINSIHGPIGIKLGGKSAPEIALSIIAQLVAETYKK